MWQKGRENEEARGERDEEDHEIRIILISIWSSSGVLEVKAVNIFFTLAAVS